MRFLPLVLLLVFVPLAFVRFYEPEQAPAPAPAPTAAARAAKVAPVATRALEEIVPADAAFVLRTADWDSIRAHAAESDWVRFFADERVTGPLRELARGLPLAIPAGFPDLHALQQAIHGGAAFFLVPGRAGGFGGGLLLQPFGDVALLERTLQELASAVQASASVTRERYADVELLRVQRPGSDEVLIAFATQELVALLFGPDPLSADELAHAVVDRRRGARTGQGFAAGRLGQSLPAHAGASTLALSADVQRLADALRPGWRSRGDARVLDEIGVSRIGWVHATLALGAGEALDLTLGMHVPADSLLSSLAQCFRPVPAGLVEGFPDRSLGVGAVGYDVARAFDALRDFLRAKHPQALQQLEAGLQMAGGQLGVDLEKDVIDQISGRFASYSVRVPESEVRPLFEAAGLPPLVAQGGALLVELRDPAPVRRALERVLLACQLEREVEEQDCDGTPVHSLSFQGVLGLHWAFTEQGLLVSEYESALLAGLRREGRGGGAELARFQQGLEELQGASAGSLVDTESSVEALLTMASTLFAAAGFGAASDAPRLPEAVLVEPFDGTLSFSLRREADRLEFRFQAR